MGATGTVALWIGHAASLSPSLLKKIKEAKNGAAARKRRPVESGLKGLVERAFAPDLFGRQRLGVGIVFAPSGLSIRGGAIGHTH